jgi:hypothetical protein
MKGTANVKSSGDKIKLKRLSLALTEVKQKKLSLENVSIELVLGLLVWPTGSIQWRIVSRISLLQANPNLVFSV